MNVFPLLSKNIWKVFDMKHYSSITLETIYQSFSDYYKSKYGNDKFEKVKSKVMFSNKLSELNGMSIQRLGVPTARDFLSAIKSMTYFMFASKDTTILACLLAIKRWDEQVNSVYHLATDYALENNVKGVFKMFGTDI